VVAGYPRRWRSSSSQPRTAEPVPDDDHLRDYTTTSSWRSSSGSATDADYAPTPAFLDRFREILAADPRRRGIRERTLRAERPGSSDRPPRVAPAGRRRAHPRAAARAAARGSR
jgi:hypothetical protein